MDASRGFASWVPVTSSNVDALLWFQRPDGTGVLCVRFKGTNLDFGPVKNYRGPVVYEYTAHRRGGTSESVYHAMLNAPSKGRFRHQYLHPAEYAVVGPLSS